MKKIIALALVHVALLVGSQASEIRMMQVGDSLQMTLEDLREGYSPDPFDDPPLLEKLPPKPVANPVADIIQGKAYDLMQYLNRLGLDADEVDLLLHFPDQGVVVSRGKPAGIERVQAVIQHIQLLPENLRSNLILWREKDDERTQVCGYSGLTRSGVKAAMATPQYEAFVTVQLSAGDFSISSLIRFNGRGALEGYLVDTVVVVLPGQHVDVATWDDANSESKYVLTFEVEGEPIYEKGIEKREFEALSRRVAEALAK